MYHTWSGVSTAINIALKFARLGQFMAIIEAIIKADFFGTLPLVLCQLDHYYSITIVTNIAPIFILLSFCMTYLFFHILKL